MVCLLDGEACWYDHAFGMIQSFNLAKNHLELVNKSYPTSDPVRWSAEFCISHTLLPSFTSGWYNESHCPIPELYFRASRCDHLWFLLHFPLHFFLLVDWLNHKHHLLTILPYQSIIWSVYNTLGYVCRQNFLHTHPSLSCVLGTQWGVQKRSHQIFCPAQVAYLGKLILHTRDCMPVTDPLPRTILQHPPGT